MAEDDNSNSNLPSGASIGIGTGAAQIEIRVQKPTGVKPTELIVSTALNTQCKEVGCDLTICGVSGIGGGGSLSNQRMYMCNLSVMQFYYEPRADWRVNITISDLSGSPVVQRNDTKLFEYLERSSIFNTGNITWESVSLIATNQRATQNLTLNNRGNDIETFVRIRAFNLTGKSYPGQQSFLPARSFRSNGTIGSECINGGINLTENVDRDVSGFLLDYGPAVSSNLHFCIFPALNSLGLQLVDQLYNANGTLAQYPSTGTKSWELTFI